VSAEPLAIADLPREKYPFVLECLHWQTHVVVWSVTVEAPPVGERVILRIPPLAKQLGHPVTVRITFADGSVQGDTGEALRQ
jgi:hypothetical protein